jgi:hypothetical protein
LLDEKGSDLVDRRYSPRDQARVRLRSRQVSFRPISDIFVDPPQEIA